MIIKKFLRAAGIGLVILAAGCGVPENVPLENAGSGNQEEFVQQDTGQVSDDEPFSSGLTCSWEEMTVSIPDAWEGKYEVEEGADGFSLVQKASREKAEGLGFLCGFYRADGMVLEEAGATLLAFTDTQVYYLAEPTDVSFYTEDEEIAEEYHQMQRMISSVAATLSVEKEGVKKNPEEYVFPLSSTVLLREEDLWNCSDDSLFIARNEIYARHGRIFENEFLAKYFSSCSWYEGKVLPKEFEEEALSEVERENIKKIEQAEEDYQKEHPYPKEYQANEDVQEDLDGDGREESVRYEVQEKEPLFVLNEKEYWLKDFDVQLKNPETGNFYVTDIASYEDGLEMAVLDDVSGENPLTYFFAYRKEALVLLGKVDGVPFREISGYNGFVNDGDVIGTVELPFLPGFKGYDYWWYDVDEGQLKCQQVGYYMLVPGKAHRLQEDLTVYVERDESQLKRVISAQEEVFLLEADTDGWVLVKGKDGVKGYVRVADGKIAGTSLLFDEVFLDADGA